MGRLASIPFHVQAYQEYAYRETVAAFNNIENARIFAQKFSETHSCTTALIDYRPLNWKIDSKWKNGVES